MKISYAWLQDLIETPLPRPEKVAELLTMHSFEIESVESVGSDTIFDIKVLPDRSHDCLSHRGIAFEVALLADLKIKSEVKKLPQLTIPESNVLKVEVASQKLCRRFSALALENIEIKESPLWLRSRLESLGQRSINNVVDATNFVMLTLGQPLHAYDSNLLADSDGGKKLIVREAHEGENVIGLDGKEYILSSRDLVIADGGNGKAIGIAGIKGGKATEITARTKHIILEAANFDPIAIRQSAKRIGLRTDASVRFENEITPELTTLALKQASDLIVEIAGTAETQVEGVIDWYPRRSAPYDLGVSSGEVGDVLGIDISDKDLKELLSRTHMSFTYVENPRKYFVEVAKTLVGTPYTLGASVLRDSPRTFDCSGLVAYAAMKSGISLPRMSVDQYIFCDEVTEERLQSGDLVFTFTPGGVGHTESKEWMPGIKIPEGIDHVGIMISPNEVLHTSVHNPDGARIESLENFLQTRELRGFRNIPSIDESRFVVIVPSERLDLRLKEDLIEEIGRIYGYENLTSQELSPFVGVEEEEKQSHYSSVLRHLFADAGFSEVYSYAFRKSGEVAVENPLAQDKAFLRPDLASGLLEALAFNSRNIDLLGLEAVRLFEIGKVFRKDGEYLSLAFGAENGKGKSLPEEGARMIALIEEKLGVKVTFNQTGSVYEVNLGDIVGGLPAPQEKLNYSVDKIFSYKPFSEYPFVLRDIAVFVPEGEDQEEIIDVARREAGGLLVSYRLFDQFTKEFPEGKKTSFAYRLVFQSFEKTLTDGEINPIMDAVTKALNDKSGWQVR